MSVLHLKNLRWSITSNFFSSFVKIYFSLIKRNDYINDEFSPYFIKLLSEKKVKIDSYLQRHFLIIYVLLIAALPMDVVTFV